MKKVILISMVAGTALFANALETAKDVAVQQAGTKVVEKVVEAVAEKAPVEAASSAEEMDKASAAEEVNATERGMEKVPALPDQHDMPNVPEIEKPDIKIIDPMTSATSDAKEKAIDKAKEVVTEKAMKSM